MDRDAKMAELDEKLRTIITDAVTAIMAVLPEYTSVHPVRVLRLTSTMSSAMTDLLADVGVNEDSHARRRSSGAMTMGGLPSVGGGIFSEYAGLIDQFKSMADGATRSQNVRNLTSALATAREMHDDDLASRLQDQVGKALASMLPSGSPVPGADLPSEIESDHDFAPYTYEDA